MPNYDFRSLSPIDFEALVRDLLQEELALTLESFKPGKDLGIDFRFSIDKDNTVVVQCKHYVESGFNHLLNVLKSNELSKITALNPSRYIVATSVALNPGQKSTITKALSPYVRCDSDVFGKDDLNNMLGKFPNIDRQTIKLWLTSLPILEEVLHADVYNMSREDLSRIKQHALLYVQNESFREAAHILEEHNFCVIAGAPGIGKTILAEMLVLHYSRAGYEVVKVSEDIKDAWKLVQPQTRRVFYYDDFLGQTSFSEKLNKNEDQRIIDFVHTVRKSTGVKLILTTREYILQQAYQQYEKLDREGFRAEKCIIDLAKYTRMNRAKILFNHVYFSVLPSKYRNHILQDKGYLTIIDHPNYSPRIVQLLTDHSRLHDVSPSKYMAFFIGSIDNPLAIWEHAFANHLSQAARNLLLVLISMPNQTFVSDAESAYQAFSIAYSKHYSPTMGPHDFRNALKELDGDFLEYEREGENILVRYQNPSVKDFVRQYLTKSKTEMAMLIEAVVFFEQISSLWSWTKDAGGRSSVRQAFHGDPVWATNLMRRLLTCPPCRIISFTSAGKTQRQYWAHPLEDRIAVFAEIGIECCAPLLDVVQEASPQLEDRMRDGRFHRYGLANIVKALDSHVETGLEWAQAFTNASWEALLIEPKSSYDLRPLCRLAEESPNTMPEGTLERVQDAICSVAESLALGEWDRDADDLREEAESLESLSRDVGVDIASDLDVIRERADELEEASGRNDENVDFSSSSSSKDEAEDDEEIASIFSLLEVTAPR
ncbi:MAG: hypothetical protein D4Q77_01200 [Methanothrix sp.]|nr:MAG: hypothetical protein D4Q77_01200 [Methanothrix sp.]